MLEPELHRITQTLTEKGYSKRFIEKHQPIERTDGNTGASSKETYLPGTTLQR